MRRSIFVDGLLCLLLAACADTGEVRQGYVVQPQDTLYSIAWRHDLDFRELARWNGIGQDFRIHVGEVLTLSAPVAVGAPHPAATSSPRPSVSLSAPATPSNPPTRAAIAPDASVKWIWPTDHTSAPRPVPGGGILLAGALGQDVRAASGGRVVYTGSGLRGYGNLIIVKHGEIFLSAYAHNREMLVHDGEEVVSGQVIAHMGEGAPQQPVLYFEIRKYGRPIDPLPLLPR